LSKGIFNPFFKQSRQQYKNTLVCLTQCLFSNERVGGD
jgi:hypothetical protein